MSLTLHTTTECLRTRFLLLALEEGGTNYDVIVHEAGYFAARGAMTGPLMATPGELLTEINVALRYVAESCPTLLPRESSARRCVDTWLEHQSTWLRPAGVRLHRAHLAGTTDADAAGLFERSLQRMEQALTDQDYLVGEFSVADCGAPFLDAIQRQADALCGYPKLEAYLERLRQRPGWAQMETRARALRGAGATASNHESDPS